MSEDIVEEVTETSMEGIARSGGWKSEDEWKGEPPEGGFKTAEDFIRDGITIQGKQHDKIDRLQHTVSKVEGNIKAMAESEAKRTKTALEGQRIRLEEERQAAFDDSDPDKFNKADNDLNITNNQLNEIQSPTSAQAEMQAAENSFAERNPWFGENVVMTNDAESLAQTIGKHSPDLGVDEFYAKIEQAIKKKHPDEFRNTNRDKSGAVSGDSPRGSFTKGNGFSSLSQEEQSAYEEISLYAPNFSKEDYAKSILEQE